MNKDSTIVTDFTVNKAALNAMGFHTVLQATSDVRYSNHNIMEYLRRIVPRMFQVKPFSQSTVHNHPLSVVFHLLTSVVEHTFPPQPTNNSTIFRRIGLARSVGATSISGFHQHHRPHG